MKYKNYKLFLRVLFILIIISTVLLPLVTQPLQTMTRNDASCAVAGGLVGTCAYDPNSCNDLTAPGASESDSSGLDISEVVGKYKLQSVMVQKLGGGSVASYKANEPPKTPASTMKLVIADTLLRTKPNLDKKVNVTQDIYYSGSNDLGRSSITLRDAIQSTLGVSSNVGANVLMKSMGGVSAFTEKANGYGYTHTDVNGYYDPSSRGKNKSTISDQVSAMNHIFSSEGEGYKVAQSALKSAANSNNHYNVEGALANKWAGTDEVAGNVAKFKIGGNDYIIGLYYNGNMASSGATTAIKSGTADLVKVVENGGGALSSGEPATATCCPTEGGSDAGNNGDGNGGDSGSWNSGLNAPYNLEEWAIETLKDLAKKKGTSESDAVTKEHVVALVAFAIGEGGDINNGDLFNPLNTGIKAPDLVDGAHDASGVQSFKSFDAGVEAAARSLAKKQYSRLATALLKPDSTAKQFMYALSYNWKYSDGAIWAEASQTDSGYYAGRLSLIKQVKSNYNGTAGLVIGTPAKELKENKTKTASLKFGSGGGTDDTDGVDGGGCSPTADASGVADLAVKLSWPNASHGTTPTEAYRRAWTKYNHVGTVADCGVFVSTVMRASGADPNYPPSGTAIQAEYVKSHPEKYDVVDKVTKVSDLQPGDILIVNQGDGAGANGHTLIYVGPQPPNKYDQASASLNSRAANLGMTQLNDPRGDYIRARLK